MQKQVNYNKNAIKLFGFIALIWGERLLLRAYLCGRLEKFLSAKKIITVGFQMAGYKGGLYSRALLSSFVSVGKKMFFSMTVVSTPVFWWSLEATGFV